jgi:hypothetical protein
MSISKEKAQQQIMTVFSDAEIQGDSISIGGNSIESQEENGLYVS